MIKPNLNKLFLSCVLCLLSFITFAQTKSSNIQTIDGKSFYIHKIEKGQSLYSVSKLYNVSLDDLYNNNPELKEGAKTNQEIKIPSGLTPTKTITTTTLNTNTPISTQVDTSKYFTYKISKGETIYSITKKFNITEAQLNAFNPGLAQGLKDGQLIAISEKNKRKSGKEIINSTSSNTTPITIDTTKSKIVTKPIKTSYNIALVLPFKLDQTIALDVNSLAKNKSNFPVVSSYAIDFY